MAVTGYEAWWIAVLIGGNKFVHKKIERDEDIIQYLINMERDFWLNHVEKDEPPMFDGSEASTRLLKQMYPESIEDSSISLGKQEELLIEARDRVDREIKALQQQKAEYENKLKAKLGSHEKRQRRITPFIGSPIRVIVLTVKDSKRNILIYIKNM